MIGSTHNHSTGSDGELTPEQLVKKAIELGWDYVYFTDHSLVSKKLFFNHPFFNKKYFSVIGYIRFKYYNCFFIKKYMKKVKELKEKYKNKIDVCFGVEFDWLEEHSDWTKKEIKKQNYDYLIGSIHNFKCRNKYRPIEFGKEYWLETAKRFEGIENYIKEYYKQIKLLIKSNLFDSVGHLDYIKIYNEKQDLFSEKSDWYKKEVLEVLDLIKENKIALEINAGGFRGCGEQFPSSWILKEARKRNILITLGLDAHLEKHFDNKIINQLINIAKEAGYDFVVRFKNRKIIEIEI